MRKRLSSIPPIVLFSLFPTLVLWIPFFLRLEEFWKIPLPQGGLATIVANYDGPLYIVIAKTLYNLEAIQTNFSFPLPVEYYAAHFPLYPLLIRAFATVMVYPYAMLAVTLISSILALYFFYKLILEHVDKNDALWLTFVFAIFPARWLIVRSVGSPEPLFVATTIASIYFFTHKKYLLAGIWGALAQLTKSPGILLFIAYAFVFIFPKFKELAVTSLPKWAKNLEYRSFPVILIPLSLLGLFYFYGQVFNDFLAYFHSGDNIHLFFPPFQIFNYAAPWVNTHWLEEVLFIYLFGILGILKLAKKGHPVYAWYTGIFFTSIIFVSHRDLLRYALPIIPFLYIAFSDILVKREFKIAITILIIPIFLYSIAFIANNTMPISDWSPLL